MKTVRSKQIAVEVDSTGFPLREAIKGHLQERGWTITDLTPDISSVPMHHRVGFALGAKIAEGELERVLTLYETGMEIHIAASKAPYVHAAVCETIPSAKRAAVANNANLLAMGAFYVVERAAMAMADAFLESELGTGYEDWEGFREHYRIGYNECESFDYAAYKVNGFEVANPQKAFLAPEPKGLAYRGAEPTEA